MRMRIVGHNLPGRTVCPSADVWHENVHIGVQERADPVQLVAGDADGAWWDLDVRVVTDGDGGLDFRGPVVHGKRGERFVYLTWGDVEADGSFRMFRRAKLVLDRVEPALVRQASRDGVLVATVDLSDEHGGPRCARVDPPAVACSYAPVS